MSEHREATWQVRPGAAKPGLTGSGRTVPGSLGPAAGEVMAEYLLMTVTRLRCIVSITVSLCFTVDLDVPQSESGSQNQNLSLE